MDKELLAPKIWSLKYVNYINKVKDRWLESHIKAYANDVRQRYPANLYWWEKIFAPLIIRNYTQTVANLISVIRLLLAIIIFLLLLIHTYLAATLTIAIISLAFILFLVASLLDLLDGPAARALDEISEIGKILDPLADKALLAAPFLTLGSRYLPPSIFLTILCIEGILIIITGIKLIIKKLPFTMATQASLTGKIKNIFELVAGAFLFFLPFGQTFIVICMILFWISVPLGIGSIIGYLSSVKLNK